MKFGLAYSHYSATCEGELIMLAIAFDKERAEDLFKKTYDEFYWQGLYVVEADGDKDSVTLPEWNGPNGGHVRSFELNWAELVPPHYLPVLRGAPCSIECTIKTYSNYS